MTKTQANEPGFVLVPREPTEAIGSGVKALEKAQVALGHIYGLADGLESIHPGKAGDIRQHAATIAAHLANNPFYGDNGPELKALDWDELNRAETEIGTYEILIVSDEDGGADQLCVELYRPSFGISFIPTRNGATFEEAKAAAQADYERRVPSCLSPVAVEEADAKAGENLFLIRKRGAYYRPNEQGYTSSIAEAGRYSREDAERITHPNGSDGPRDGMDYVPAPSTPSPQIGKAEAGPVGDAVAWQYLAPGMSGWLTVETEAFAKTLAGDHGQTRPLYARPVEEPGELGACEVNPLARYWFGSSRRWQAKCEAMEADHARHGRLVNAIIDADPDFDFEAAPEDMADLAIRSVERMMRERDEARHDRAIFEQCSKEGERLFKKSEAALAGVAKALQHSSFALDEALTVINPKTDEVTYARIQATAERARAALTGDAQEGGK